MLVLAKCRIFQNIDTSAIRYFKSIYYIHTCVKALCLQCFDAVGWAAGRASGL